MSKGYVRYSKQVQAIHGTQPFTWTGSITPVTTGAGVSENSIDSTGLISSLLETATDVNNKPINSEYQATATVTDSAGLSDTRFWNFKVNVCPQLSTYYSRTGTTISGLSGEHRFTLNLVANSGVPPFTWSVRTTSSYQIPISLENTSDTSADLVFGPTSDPTFIEGSSSHVYVQVTDSQGKTLPVEYYHILEVGSLPVFEDDITVVQSPIGTGVLIYTLKYHGGYGSPDKFSFIQSTANSGKATTVNVVHDAINKLFTVTVTGMTATADLNFSHTIEVFDVFGQSARAVEEFSDIKILGYRDRDSNVHASTPSIPAVERWRAIFYRGKLIAYALDAKTDQTIELGTFKSAFHVKGSLVLYFYNSNPEYHKLYQIDPATLALTYIGDLGALSQTPAKDFERVYSYNINDFGSADGVLTNSYGFSVRINTTNWTIASTEMLPIPDHPGLTDKTIQGLSVSWSEYKVLREEPSTAGSSYIYIDRYDGSWNLRGSSSVAVPKGESYVPIGNMQTEQTYPHGETLYTAGKPAVNASGEFYPKYSNGIHSDMVLYDHSESRIRAVTGLPSYPSYVCGDPNNHTIVRHFSSIGPDGTGTPCVVKVIFTSGIKEIINIYDTWGIIPYSIWTGTYSSEYNTFAIPGDYVSSSYDDTGVCFYNLTYGVWSEPIPAGFKNCKPIILARGT